MNSSKPSALALILIGFAATQAQASMLDFFESPDNDSVTINMDALSALKNPPAEVIEQQEIAYISPPPRAAEIIRSAPPPEQKEEVTTTKETSLPEKLNGKFSGGVSFTNDYSYRGITQNNNRPAVQGNLDFTHNSGVKIGAWASNVNFGSGSATLETDIYASYTRDLEVPYLGGLATETGIIRYAYPGAKSKLHYTYNEIYENLGYDLGLATLGASFSYSPNFTGDSGSAYYPKLAVSVPLPHDFLADGWVGRQYIKDNSKAGLPNYTDWALGLAYTIDDFTVKGQYADTDISKSDCPNGCGSKGIVTVSKIFK